MTPKQIRLSLGLSQKQLAFIVGNHQDTISSYERGLMPTTKMYMLALNYLYDNRHQLASIIDLENNELFQLFGDIKVCKRCNQTIHKVKPPKLKRAKRV